MGKGHFSVIVKIAILPQDYCRIYSVRTNGPTLCPWLWLPYVPEPVVKPLREAHGFVLYTNA